jgi:hypothetical protein
LEIEREQTRNIEERKVSRKLTYNLTMSHPPTPNSQAYAPFLTNEAPELNRQGGNRVHSASIRKSPFPLATSTRIPRLLRIHCENLLEQDMLPRVQGEKGVREVVRVRGCDVDDLDGLILNQLLVASVGR